MTLMDHGSTVDAAITGAEPLDWSRVQGLYVFCRARAIERVLAAQGSASLRKHRRELHVLESMYGKARQHRDVVAGCAVTYFRAQALRDANHPDFQGGWL